MRRVKQLLVTLICVDGSDDRTMVVEAAVAAKRFSDEVHVIEAGRHTPSPSLYGDLEGDAMTNAVALPIDSPHFRSHAYRLVRSGYSDERVYVIFLEVAQRIDLPDLVRPTIEFNEGQIITAMRYFLWDDEHYRTDGLFAPRRLPFAAPSRQRVHWTNGFSTAPDWMWSARNMWMEAPFVIVDQTLLWTNGGSGAPVLAPLAKMTSYG